MKRQPNKKFVGAFVLAGIVAFLAILIIAFGAGYRNRNKDLYVMYFHESIKGLSIGSPVVLSGVEVGKVVKIEIVPDIQTHEFNIPVYIAFNNIQKIISSPVGHQACSKNSTSLSSLTELSSNFENIPFKDVVENLNATLTEFKEILGPAARVSRDISNKSVSTLNNFNHAVEDVSRAANSLRNLTDYLEQHPDALIRGRR